VRYIIATVATEMRCGPRGRQGMLCEQHARVAPAARRSRSAEWHGA
jgi:hypothetical protein